MGTVDDVLRIAKGEVGYSRWDDPQPGTKYGRWYAELTGNSYYGASGVPYCAMWDSWVFDQAGVSCAGLPGAYCPSMLNEAYAAGRVRSSKYDAQPGDVVYFDWNGGEVDHVGIVKKNCGSYIETYEGNTSSASNANGGQVAQRTRNWSCVVAVVIPYYDGTSSAKPSQPNFTPTNSGVYPRKGWSGAEVKKVQQALVDKGYDIGSYGVDGDFGPATDKAVRAFQSDNGLEVDGIVGPITQSYLYKTVGSPTPTPAPAGGIEEDGVWGSDTTRAIQRYFGSTADGYMSGQNWGDINKINRGGITSSAYRIGSGGSAIVRKIQERVGSTADGYLGPNTIKAMQRHFGTPVDGAIDNPSQMVRAMQRALNEGRF